MSKKATMSNCRDPENRSKKSCVCGGHSTGARKKRKAWKDVIGSLRKIRRHRRAIHRIQVNEAVEACD